jgi:hypothetical protein
VIVFVTTERHRYTNRDLLKACAGRVKGGTYEEMFNTEYLPRATYVFTDMDRLSPRELERAARSYRMLKENGLPALNDPSRFLGRYGLLRRLHKEGINRFNAYRVDSFEVPKRWPVFLRAEGDHKRPLSGLINDQAELDATVARLVDEGAPLGTLLIIEYAAEEVRPGLYRKLSVFRVGERMVTFTCVHDDQWLVKYGKPAIAPPELYQDEYDMVANNPFGPEMRRIFDLAGLEYGRVDFGLVEGRPQIYEVNSNPDVKLDPKSTGVTLRDRSNALFKQNYVAAIEALDNDPPPAGA